MGEFEWMVGARWGASLCTRIKRSQQGGRGVVRGRDCEEGQDSNSKWRDVPIVSGDI